MKKMRGGTAGNIAYTLALLNAKAAVVSAAGQDFAEYRDFMTGKGIDVRGIKVVQNEFTASCFINTDQANNQIVAFYPGAVGHAREVTLASLGLEKGDWVIISPTDPESQRTGIAGVELVREGGDRLGRQARGVERGQNSHVHDPR